VYAVSRARFAALAALALLPAAVQVIFQCTLDAVRLSPAETQRRIAAAGPVDEITAAGIAGLPTLPVVAIFALPLIAATTLYLASAYFLVIRQANGQPLGPAGALQTAAARVPRFAGWTVVSWLGCCAALFLLVLPGALLHSLLLQGAGMMLAGVLLMVFSVILFAAFPGVMIIERAGLTRCFQLVKGRFWATFARAATVGLVYYLYGLALGLVVKLVAVAFGGPPATSGAGSIALHVVNGALTIPLPVFLAAATLVSYAELRHREDRAIGTRTLAAELG
jgi:hypothetical protein